MFGFKFLATAALLAQSALASPTPVTPELTPELAKRGEGIHLFNCWPWGGAGVSQTWLSIVVYCANDSDCSSLQHNPSSDNVCVKKSSGSESYHTWEGGPQSCTFPSGVTFSWNIPWNAQSQADYTSVGSGSNGYRSFTGYKDDKSVGSPYNYHTCSKIYYYV